MKNKTYSDHISGVVFRSIALFAILYQFRFIADDLADTAVFSATLCAAFAAAVFLANRMKGMKPLRRSFLQTE